MRLPHVAWVPAVAFSFLLLSPPPCVGQLDELTLGLEQRRAILSVNPKIEGTVENDMPRWFSMIS